MQVLELVDVVGKITLSGACIIAVWALWKRDRERQEEMKQLYEWFIKTLLELKKDVS